MLNSDFLIKNTAKNEPENAGTVLRVLFPLNIFIKILIKIVKIIIKIPIKTRVLKLRALTKLFGNTNVLMNGTAEIKLIININVNIPNPTRPFFIYLINCFEL